MARIPARAAAILLLAVVAGSSLACDDDHDGVYVQMLRLVPDDATGRTMVTVGDLDRYRKLIGFEAPREGSDPSAYIVGLMSQEEVPFPGIVFMGSFNAASAMQVAAVSRESLGVGLDDVDQWMALSSARHARTVLRGRFEPDRVGDLLAACDACPPADAFVHRGAQVYGWDAGSDVNRRFAPPLFNKIGRGGYVAIDDRYVVHGFERNDVTGMLDAQEGDSLADHEAFRLAAESIEEMGALGAVISDFAPDRSFAERLADAGRGEAWAIAAAANLLLPYEVVAYGPAYAEGERFTAFVFVHASEADARANADRLLQRLEETPAAWPAQAPARMWSERADRIDVQVDGRVLRARMYGVAVPLFQDTLSPVLVTE